MLRNVTKALIILVGLIKITSCNSPKEKCESYVEMNFNNYSNVYELLKDSISFYVNSRLEEFTPEYMYGWTIDSMICINSTNDKLVAMTIEIPSNGKGFYNDDAMKLLGKRISGKWYFFRGGGTLTIPRKTYGYSESNHPTSKFLSQIARKEFLESALVKNDKGEYIVSDEWVNNHFEYNGMCAHCTTHEQYDSTHWQKITDKWLKKIDTVTYKKFNPKPNT